MKTETTTPTPPTSQPTIASHDLAGQGRKSSGSKRKILVVLAALGVLFVVGGVGAYWKLVLTNPEVILKRAFEQIEEADSIKIGYKSPEGNVTSTMSLFRDEEALSEVTVSANNLGEENPIDLMISMRISKDLFYLQPKIGKLQKLETELVTDYPFIPGLQTYQLVRPILLGNSWLEIDIPETEEIDEEVLEEIEEENEDLAEDLRDAVIVKEVDLSYKEGGEKFTRMIFGFDKDKLIEIVDSIKDQDVDVKISQVNAVIRVIESSDAWDEDLVEVLINSDGQLKKITLRAPEIDPEVLENSLQEGFEDESGQFAGMLKQFSGKVSTLIEDKPEAKLMELGVITFDKYGQVKPIAAPTQVVHVETVMQAAQTELLPLLGALLTNAGQPSEPFPATRGIIGTPPPVPAFPLQ